MKSHVRIWGKGLQIKNAARANAQGLDWGTQRKTCCLHVERGGNSRWEGVSGPIAQGRVGQGTPYMSPLGVRVHIITGRLRSNSSGLHRNLQKPMGSQLLFYLWSPPVPETQGSLKQVCTGLVNLGEVSKTKWDRHFSSLCFSCLSHETYNYVTLRQRISNYAKGSEPGSMEKRSFLFIYRPKSLQAAMPTDLHPYWRWQKGRRLVPSPASWSVQTLFKATLEPRTFSWIHSKQEWRCWCMIFLQNMQAQELTDFTFTSNTENHLWILAVESCCLQAKNNSIKNNNKTKLAQSLVFLEEGQSLVW